MSAPVPRAGAEVGSAPVLRAGAEVVSAPVLRARAPAEASRHFDPVLRPDLAPLYAARAARLRALAEGHDLGDYLRFAAEVAGAQAACACAGGAGPVAPIDAAALAREGDWPATLDRMLDLLRGHVPAAAEPHLATLAAMGEADRRAAAGALAAGEFDRVDPALGPLIWAALSLATAEAARRASLPAAEAPETADCPVCGGPPVASHIHTGERQGLRYLHCALCECEWHVVRAKCAGCGDAEKVDYLSFETPEAAVRAEACGACGGYLKLVSAERDPQVETVADDLATLLLDDAARAEGFGRSGVNPFALPG